MVAYPSPKFSEGDNTFENTPYAHRPPAPYQKNYDKF